MRSQHIGVHASGANKAQPAGVAYRAGQLPAAGPYHAGLYNGILDPEQLRNTVLKVLLHVRMYCRLVRNFVFSHGGLINLKVAWGFEKVCSDAYSI
jgi:hypothetical protein